MNIDKDTVLNMLRERGDHDKADQASRELPDQVDTDQDGGLLGKFNLDPQELMGKLGGFMGKDK